MKKTTHKEPTACPRRWNCQVDELRFARTVQKWMQLRATRTHGKTITWKRNSGTGSEGVRQSKEKILSSTAKISVSASRLAIGSPQSNLN